MKNMRKSWLAIFLFYQLKNKIKKSHGKPSFFFQKLTFSPHQKSKQLLKDENFKNFYRNGKASLKYGKLAGSLFSKSARVEFLSR